MFIINKTIKNPEIYVGLERLILLELREFVNSKMTPNTIQAMQTSISRLVSNKLSGELQEKFRDVKAFSCHNDPGLIHISPNNIAEDGCHV